MLEHVGVEDADFGVDLGVDPGVDFCADGSTEVLGSESSCELGVVLEVVPGVAPGVAVAEVVVLRIIPIVQVLPFSFQQMCRRLFRRVAEEMDVTVPVLQMVPVR